MNMSRLKGNLATNAFMLVLGLLLFIPAAQRMWVYASFYTNAVSVMGSVDKPSSGAGFGGRPLISYQDLSGAVHVFKSRVKTHFFMAPRKNEQVRVLFLESDPDQAMVDSSFHYILLPLGFLLIGAGVVLLALKNSWREIAVLR